MYIDAVAVEERQGDSDLGVVGHRHLETTIDYAQCIAGGGVVEDRPSEGNLGGEGGAVGESLGRGGVPFLRAVARGGDRRTEGVVIEDGIVLQIVDNQAVGHIDSGAAAQSESLETVFHGTCAFQENAVVVPQCGGNPFAVGHNQILNTGGAVVQGSESHIATRSRIAAQVQVQLLLGAHRQREGVDGEQIFPSAIVEHDASLHGSTSTEGEIEMQVTHAVDVELGQLQLAECDIVPAIGESLFGTESEFAWGYTG